MGYNFFQITELKAQFKKKRDMFIATLGAAISRGEKIAFADNDINYVLQLQNERLKQKHLSMEYELYDRDSTRNATVGSQWKDAHFESYVCSEQIGVKRKIVKDGAKLFSDNRKTILYTTITDVTSGVHPDDEPCSCPNCGNVSTIAQIRDGCTYCGTMYKMDDLFPKVTGYYSLNDVGLAGNEGKKGIALSMIITYIAMVLLAVIFMIIRNDLHPKGFLVLIPLTPIALFAGYFFYSIFLMIRVIAVGTSQSAGKYGTIGSRNKFEQRMKKISPEFSFEYFTSKAISLIKTAIYSEKPQELQFYTGGPLAPQFGDMIDLNYGGALGVVAVKEENNAVTVATDVFFDVLYETGSKIKFQREVFRAVFQRRTDIPINLRFSMTAIQCQGCNASFNAVRNKICPYCGREYDITSDDWVLTELRFR